MWRLWCYVSRTFRTLRVFMLVFYSLLACFLHRRRYVRKAREYGGGETDSAATRAIVDGQSLRPLFSALCVPLCTGFSCPVMATFCLGRSQSIPITFASQSNVLKAPPCSWHYPKLRRLSLRYESNISPTRESIYSHACPTSHMQQHLRQSTSTFFS